MAADNQRGVLARAERKVTDTDARGWHPWLRINRVLRTMLHTRWSAGGVVADPDRVQAGARVAERDSARMVVRLAVAHAPDFSR